MEKQFDFAVGGSETVPICLNVYKYAQARVHEIVSLTNATEPPEGGGLIFQRLPKAMRRRVMSANSKRMPKRLQEAHLKQLEKNGGPQKNKCPCRKYRRKPGNSLLEYNRKQRNFTWLETHIWHAKRFRMVEKWGYKVAETPYAKVFRSSYRAYANHCFLQDISYCSCIEIRGPQETIIDSLNLHTSNTVGLTFGAKAYLDGCKEGHVTFFSKNKFPFEAIGTISFLWKAEEKSSKKSERTLWLWTHPSIYSEISACLLETFSAKEEIVLHDRNKYGNSFVNEKEMKKLETHHVFDPPPSFLNRAENIMVIMLKDKFNRFRLTGPLSHSVLLDMLHVISEFNVKSSTKTLKRKDVDILQSQNELEICDRVEGSSVESTIDTRNTVNLKWWKTHYQNNDLRRAHNMQCEFWKSMRGIYSPAQLPPHQVVALTVLDPRYQLPVRRMKSVPDPNVLPDPNVCTNIPRDISLSPIWNSDVRMSTTLGKLSNCEWTKLRSQLILLPGISEAEINCAKEVDTSLVNGNDSDNFESSYVSVVLIQRPGSQDPLMKRLGFNSGWDIIIPSGWAMPFWMALIFRGARPGGLKEATSLEFEAGTFGFLEQFAPDTAAGKKEAENMKLHHKDTYFRLPPNKRPNYTKLGIASPFSCCWDILMRDWCQNKLKEDLHGSFYVLRERSKLDVLKSIVNSSRGGCNMNGNNRTDQISQFSNLFSNMNHNCLIPIRIESVKKGYPADFAIICIPNSEDLVNVQKKSSFQGPKEPVHSDSNKAQRKELKHEHTKELKRLRKKRVKENIKLRNHMDLLLEQGESISHLISVKKDKMPAKEIIDKYAQDLENLWVPEIKNIKESCSRSIAGFVLKGDFCLSEGHGAALGYMPLPALIHLISTWIDKPIVLFRNPNSFQYYFANLKIC